MKILAKTISYLFNPFILPTWGFLALFNAGYYFSMLSWEIKRFVLIAVFFSTGLLPLLTLSILALSPRFNIRMNDSSHRVKPLFFSALYYYLGFYLLRDIALYPVFRVFLISSVVLIVLLLIISFKWKISIHMAGMGGVTGMILAVSYKMGINPVFLIAGTFLAAGLVGTARIYLGRHTPGQVLWGYFTGLAILYLSVLYS